MRHQHPLVAGVARELRRVTAERAVRRIERLQAVGRKAQPPDRRHLRVGNVSVIPGAVLQRMPESEKADSLVRARAGGLLIHAHVPKVLFQLVGKFDPTAAPESPPPFQVCHAGRRAKLGAGAGHRVARFAAGGESRFNAHGSAGLDAPHAALAGLCPFDAPAVAVAERQHFHPTWRRALVDHVVLRKIAGGRQSGSSGLRNTARHLRIDRDESIMTD